MIHPSYYDVWAEWFGDSLGRGVGNPKRDFINHYRGFIKFIERNESMGGCSYMSVQPFDRYESPYCLERMFYDFDNKEDPEKAGDEALAFKARLEKFYDVEPIIVFSGNKGYHVWVYLETHIGKGLTVSQLKAVYSKLMKMLVGNAEYDALDSSVVGDIKQLARIPYTHHEMTGKLCAFVDDDRNPIMVARGFTEHLREKGLSFELCKSALYKVGREEKERQEQKRRSFKSTRRYDKTIRSCVKAVLASGNIHTLEHLMKLATVAELNANGWGAEKIINAFRGMAGFNERKTSYFVRHAIRTGYRPFRCTKIQSIGGCLGSECLIYGRRERKYSVIT